MIASYLLVLQVLKKTNVSEVIALRQSSILFGVVFGIWFLKEKHGFWKAIGAMVMLAGFVLIII
ncbi:MAG: drug/metabolite transporter (DMT)-like permease [Candidatus Woesearchaeota archaeon]|jgi:drug/metabolite transporter (DMT)-like permease